MPTCWAVFISPSRALQESTLRRLSFRSALANCSSELGFSTRWSYENLTVSYNFSAFSTILDVGGGEGGLIVLVLKANPHLRAILFDSPEVILRAKSLIDDQGLSARCELVAGSFLEKVPKGGDLYVLANVINNWRDNQALQILRNCREAMSPQARMIVIEPLYASGGQSSRLHALVGLMVMAQRGGRWRSESEMRTLLNSSGLRPLTIHRMPAIRIRICSKQHLNNVDSVAVPGRNRRVARNLDDRN